MADQTVVARLLAHRSSTPNESALDDLVHDTKSSEASAINNEGVASQIRYLLDAGVSEATITATLDGDEE